MQNPLRTLFQKFGIDVRRYRSQIPDLAMLSTYGIRTVIDVGANKGQFADEIALLLPTVEIYAFEPIKASFDVLKAKEAKNSRLHAFPYAIGDKKETRKMNRSNYSPSSSLLPKTEALTRLFPHTDYSGEENVEVRLLDDALSSVQLTPNVLLNIDVQGYEMRVLAGATRTLTQTRAIIIESSFVPLYEGGDLFSDVYEFLNAYGFKYQGSVRNKRDNKTGAIISEDSLYVRRNRSINS